MRRAWARAAAAGIQAQDRRPARLSVWTRARHLDGAAIEDARVGDRSVVAALDAEVERPRAFLGAA